MGQDTRPPALITDHRTTQRFWLANAALDSRLAQVGPHVWAVYCALCRWAGVPGNVQTQLAQSTGLGWPTIAAHIAELAREEVGLIRILPQFMADGSRLPDAYELLDVAITPVDVTPTASRNGSGAVPDLWALRPLAAALAELPTSKNRLAVVARLYAMRFDADVYPFDFARFGKLARAVSGGATRLCQIIWTTDPTHVRGAPIDLFTAVLSKETKVAAVAAQPHVEDDPQMLAYARARAANGL
jgi:hypothetical protein